MRHIFGSHTQAKPAAEARAVRVRQFVAIKAFIDARQIPADEPVFIAGDLNVDLRKSPDEVEVMLSILNAELPPQTGYGATFDPFTNKLAEPGDPEYLDYVLWSKSHGAPLESSNEARIVRSFEEWKEFGFERGLWELSDHYPVVGKFRFGQFVGVFVPTSYDMEFVYGVRPDGTLQWYSDRIASDVFSAHDKAEMIVGGRYHMKTLAEPPTAAEASVPPPQSPGTTGGMSQRTLDRERRNLGAPNRSVGDRPAGAAGTAAAGKVVVAPWLVEPLPARKYTHQWEGPKEVGTGWTSFQDIIPAGRSSMYGLAPDGVLNWYKHVSFTDGALEWKGPVNVGTGWTGFTKIVGGGDGVLYGIKPDGTLLWYRHLDAADTSAEPQWSGPTEVGSGWTIFKDVFSTAEGVVYGIKPDGVLLWYRHTGYQTGAPTWDGPLEVGSGWQNFRKVFSTGRGRIFAIREDGTLLCYQHNGYRGGSLEWQGPMIMGSGWDDFVEVFPLMWSPYGDLVVR
jgi:Tachylectin/Endonuclease/Exonuclease/phosphatase family